MIVVDAELSQTLRAQVRRRAIKASDGQRALEHWSRMGVERFGAVGLLDRVWALRHNLSAHDATYVALAEALDCALLTGDARLAGAPGPKCPITIVPR